MNKKALKPLVATVVLVGISLLVGLITMNFGKSYSIGLEVEEEVSEDLVIDMRSIDTDLKELQILHITGKISEEEYLKRE